MKTRLFVLAGLAGLLVAAIAAFSACGGTTGREGIPGEVAPDASVSVDATMVADGGDGGDLDATAETSAIMYADRVLPDIAVPVPVGEAGPTHVGPDCPPFLPVDSNGEVTDANPVNEIPSDYDDAGNIVFASDASPCATYPWLGSITNDQCTTSQAEPSPPFFSSLLPPCSWCGPDAGSAKDGPRKGDPRVDICWALYDCLSSSRCMGGAAGAAACLCGDSGANCMPTGPCAQEEIAALELPRGTDLNTALVKAYYNFENGPIMGSITFTGACGGIMNLVYEDLLSASSGKYPACPDAGF
jgi:hypothetical protein